MKIRYPRALQPGDTIGITAPSAGVQEPLWERLQFCVKWLQDKGFHVEVGECIRTPTHVSAPKHERAAELNAMLTSPHIRAVVPPWGGETGIDLLDLLDYDAIAAAEPTWFVGFSDTSTVLLPVTLRTGIATLHGQNLMDTPNELPTGFVPWWKFPSEGAVVEQRASRQQGLPGWLDWANSPSLVQVPTEANDGWRVLAGPPTVEVSGRLIGGCIETLGMLAGTSYGDVRAFGAHSREGLLVYLEASEGSAFDIDRLLHAMRLAGWFEHATGILMGRTQAPDDSGFSQADAVLDALGDLGVPIIADMDFGHVWPRMVFVNGALGRVVVNGSEQRIVQTQN